MQSPDEDIFVRNEDYLCDTMSNVMGDAKELVNFKRLCDNEGDPEARRFRRWPLAMEDEGGKIGLWY